MDFSPGECTGSFFGISKSTGTGIYVDLYRYIGADSLHGIDIVVTGSFIGIGTSTGTGFLSWICTGIWCLPRIGTSTGSFYWDYYL